MESKGGSGMERSILWQRCRRIVLLVLCIVLGMTLFGLLAQTEETELQEPALRGSGSILYGEGVSSLSLDQEAPIQSYMEAWYESLSDLTPRELSGLFTDDMQLRANRSSLELQIALRQAAPVDYSLQGYSYTLECIQMDRQEDGSVRIGALEDSVQNFSALPEVDAQRFGSYHHFTLEQTDGVWKIRTHYQYDVLQMEGIRARMESAGDGGFPSIPVSELAEDSIRLVPEYQEAILTAAREREEQREDPLPDTRADHPYLREEAVEYASTWAEERNPDWVDYSRSGGNCQNFASQSLLAGGIPMDITGDYVWKWYGSTVANSPGAYGRSSSWSGVKQFMAYAAGNTGPGLVAVTDAPYFTGEAGDLIHMGMEEDWRHTVVISRPVLDQAGQVQDYLVDSNTGNLRNFPASLYGYADLSLTKIIGWND